MLKSWTIFRAEAITINERFPGLHFSEDRETPPSVYGALILTDSDGQLVDTYQIKILPSAAYPFKFPLLFETGGRIPHNIDWHVFPGGLCCIQAQPEELLLCHKGISLYWFIERQVKPYFFNQKYREIHGFFLRERSHGSRGNVEFLEDLLGTHNRTKIIDWLLFILQRKEPSQTSYCFCGNGQKYRRCHRSAFRALNKLTDLEIQSFVRIIEPNFNFSATTPFKISIL